MQGRPGPRTPATPTRLVPLHAATDGPAALRGTIDLAVRGAWDLEFYVSGPAGDAVALIAVTATAPRAMPVWAGWLIGLSPLVGLGRFFWWNRGYLRTMRVKDEHQASG